MTIQAPLAAASENEERAWKFYTNARFGFSVRYPENWRLGNPLPEGIGVTLYPPIDNSLVALSGHMNVLEGKSQDGRQTLDEFAMAHRRIITELLRQENDHGEVAAGSGDVAGRIPCETIDIHVFG